MVDTVPGTEPSKIGWGWSKVHHWTWNGKGTRTLHKGLAKDCKRVHYTPQGERVTKK